MHAKKPQIEHDTHMFTMPPTDGTPWTGPPHPHLKLRLVATDPAVLESRIRELAYLKAERRGFAPGHELEDWLEAERELSLVRPPDID